MDTMLATIGIVVKEPWAVDISYEMLNYTLYAVEDGGDGCGYIALRDNIGVTPGSDETVWRKAVQAGQSIYDLAVKYHHFVGTEEEFEAQYQAALQAALDAAAGASAVEAQVEAAEALRVQAESSRESAETARAAAESARAAAETSRDTAESSRASAESSRASAETGRSEAETARQSAETTRQSNETAREGAEASRTQQFQALKADMQVAIGQADAAATSATEAAASAAQTESNIESAEASRVTAEQGRVTAEQGRASAEQGRVSAESARVIAEAARETQAGTDHTRAESDHTRAGADHTQAGSDHSTASGDHVQAGNDHTTAAADHTQAESDHTRAESDHAVVEGYNTRLTNVEGEVSQLGQKVNRKIGFFENTETVVSGVEYTNTIYGDFKAGDVVVCELIGNITTLTGTVVIIDDSSASLVTTRAGMVNVISLPRDTTYLQLSKLNPNYSGALTFRVHFGDLQDFINEEIGRKAEIYENILSSRENITKTSSVRDKVIGSNGSPVSVTGFSYDCYSISDVTKRYYFKTGITAYAVVLVHYYASGSQIGGEVLSATEKTTYAGFLTVPASTDEIRINRNSADASVLYATTLYDGSIPDAIGVIPKVEEILSDKTNISLTSSTTGKFLKNNGTLGNAGGFAVDYYDITDSDKEYFFITKSGGSGINAVHYFNGETHLGYQYPITSGTTDYSGPLSIPSGTTTIAINRNSGDTSSLYYKELYNGSLVEKVLDNSDRITAIEGGLSNIVLMGDSITWLSGVNCTDDRGWGKWFKDKFNPQTIKNYAWSGATWSNTENTVATDTEISSLDDNNTIWQQIRRLIADVNNDLQVTPDAVIIAAGVNDVIGNEAGERPDAFSKTAEQAFSNRNSYITGASVQTITTLADSVRYGCEMLIQAFPNVQIILATPLQATRGDTPLDKMATARQIIKDCAAFLSANVIEQDKVCGVYYTQEKVGHHNLYDGLHTNATGAKKVGRIIASIVKSMID